MGINFTIVIPTHNRSPLLKELLLLLEKNKYREQWEVIVIDDGSSDDTGGVVGEFKARKILNLRYFYQKQTGPSRARNSGIKLSKYPYIILMDDDIRVKNNFLYQCSQAILRHPSAGVIVANVNKLVADDTNKLHQYVNTFKKQYWLFALTDNAMHKKERVLSYPDSLCSACICIKKERNPVLFNELVGTYYQTLFVGAEDYEFAMRHLRNGVNIVQDYRIQVSHYISSNRLSYGKLIKRLFFTGVEHRVADAILFNDKPRYSRVKYVIKDAFLSIMDLSKGIRIYLFVSMLNDVLFAAGYLFCFFAVSKEELKNRMSMSV